MDIRYHSAWGLLSRTIHVLATHPGNAKERLKSASNIFVPLTLAELPTELQKDWKWVIARLTNSEPLIDPYGNEISTSLEVSLHRMRTATAAKIASKIYDVWWELGNSYNS